MSKPKEIFVDATHNTSKTPSYLYAIVCNERGYGIPLGFLMMSVGKMENTDKHLSKAQALCCNQNFFAKAKELGLNPTWVHTDKDMSEISAAKVRHPLVRCEHSGMIYVG